MFLKSTANRDLTGISDRANTHEVGVQFIAANGSSGGTAIYTDEVSNT